MATNPEGPGVLREESDTLSPLPDYHRQGLLAVAVLGILSFVSSSGLLLYLSYKLAKWRLQPPTTSGQQQEEQIGSNDLSLGLAQKNFGNVPPKPTVSEDDARQQQRQVKRGARISSSF